MATANRFSKAYTIHETEPRGICVVIDGTSNNSQAQLDTTRVNRTFRALNFIVQTHKGLTGAEIKKTFEKYSRIDHTNFYCFVAIVLAPADSNGHICGSDGEQVDLTPLLEAFCSDPTLNGKPKIFLLQKYQQQQQQQHQQEIEFSKDANDLLFCSMTSAGLTAQMTFFRLYENITMMKADDTQMSIILKEAHEAYGDYIQSNQLDIVFEFDMLDKLSHELYLTLEGIPVIRRQVKNDAIHNRNTSYPMDHVIKGYCIVINNLGSEFEPDCRTIKEVFQTDLGFHFEQYNNLSVNAMDMLLHTLAEIDQSWFRCLTIVMFCEGDNQTLTIRGSDDKDISMTEIESWFSHKNCVTLASKPKLFVYNLKQYSRNVSAQNVRRMSARNLKKVSLQNVRKLSQDSLRSVRRVSSRRGSRRNGSEETLQFMDYPDEDHTRSTDTPNVFRVLCPVQEGTRNLERSFPYAFWEAVRTTSTDSGNNTLPTLERILECTNAEKELHKPNICRQLILSMVKEYDRDQELIVVSAELRMAYTIWNPIRKKTIAQLHLKEEELIRTTKNVRIARSVGAGVGIIGGAVALGGFIMAPFTLGGSLVVSGIGAGIGAAGGLTSIGATVAEKVIEKSELKEVNNLLAIHDQLCKEMQSLYKLLEDEARRLAHDNPKLSSDDVMFSIVRAGESVLRVGSVGATGVSIAGVGILEGGIFAARIASKAVASVAVVGGVLNAILLPVSVIELGVTVHALATEKNTRAITELRTLIEEFENNRLSVENYFNGVSPNEDDDESDESDESDGSDD